MDESLITPTIRRTIYVIMAVAGLGIGATQVGYSSISAEQPDWLTVATAVYAYLSGGSGILAALNTRRQQHASTPDNQYDDNEQERLHHG